MYYEEALIRFYIFGAWKLFYEEIVRLTVVIVRGEGWSSFDQDCKLSANKRLYAR